MPFIRWLAAPYPEGVHSASIILHASRPQMGLEVGSICAGVSARSPIFSPSRTLGNRNPDPSASAHCINSAAGRYPTMAATVRISRQTRFFLTPTAWGKLRNVFPNRRLKVNPSPPVISRHDATTPRCQLLSPTSEVYLDRVYSVAHVPVIAPAVLVVRVPEAACL